MPTCSTQRRREMPLDRRRDTGTSWRDTMTDRKTKGAWLVHHAQKLSSFQSAPEYENIEIAGKAGVLLSGLASSAEETLTEEQVRAVAAASGLKRLELDGLLEQLESKRLIYRQPGRIHVMGVTTSAVLEHTSSFFDDLGPNRFESASIGVSEIVSARPLEGRELREQLQDEYLMASSESSTFIEDVTKLGFVDTERLDAERAIFFNGNLFRRDNPQKLYAVTNSLSAQESRRIQQLDQLLRNDGCVQLAVAQQIVGQATFDKVHSIGMFDVNKIANSTESVYYVTRPAAFGKYGDAFVDDAMDLAKAFVTCLTYGMTRSSSTRGRIRMLELLMRKLIRGDWVGPARAIGEDYKVLEYRRVVQTRDEGGGAYSMRLLKPEVGELALQVLTEGDASDQSLPLPGVAATSYAPPELTRVGTRKQQSEPSKRAMSEILLALRTGVGT